MGLFPGTTFARGKHTSPLNIREADTRFRGSSQRRVVAITPLCRSLSLKQDEGNNVQLTLRFQRCTLALNLTEFLKKRLDTPARSDTVDARRFH